jgi:hypothetical protein
MMDRLGHFFGLDQKLKTGGDGQKLLYGLNVENLFQPKKILFPFGKGNQDSYQEVSNEKRFSP